MYLAVLVVALGYFVDIFDLTLFSMLRGPSLTALGIRGEGLMDSGIMLLNVQMAGMLVGGFFWGSLGDKKGRIGVLFGSILCYSLANLLNAFIYDVNSYAVLRFISGFGLAGELGVGITLISELMPKHTRGIGTTIVTALGVLGACAGGVFVEFFSWRQCYFIGGVLGLLLLLLRIRLKDSDIFLRSERKDGLKWGDFGILFKRKALFLKFVLSSLIGVPIWCVAGIVMAFAPEIAKSIGVAGNVTASRTIAISYLGVAIGDLMSGLLSQWMRKRVRVVQIFLVLTLLFVIAELMLTPGHSPEYFYFWAFMVGLGTGYWTLFVTMGAEQFGTNLRASVATTIPNIVRGAVIPMTLVFKFLKTEVGLLNSIFITGGVVFFCGMLSTFFLPETFGKDLAYFEEASE
jgi:putative MFS transporter